MLGLLWVCCYIGWFEFSCLYCVCIVFVLWVVLDFGCGLFLLVTFALRAFGLLDYVAVAWVWFGDCVCLVAALSVSWLFTSVVLGIVLCGSVWFVVAWGSVVCCVCWFAFISVFYCDSDFVRLLCWMCLLL